MATNYPGSLDTFSNPSSSSTLDSPSHAAQHANINDAMEAVQTKLGVGAGTIGTYTAITPTFGSATVGNGIVNARYTKINKLVHFAGYFQLGGTSAIASYVDISVPVTGVPSTFQCPGNAMFYDASGGIYAGHSFFVGSTTIRVAAFLATGTYASNADLSATVPITWTTGDVIFWNLTYEAA